MCTSTILNVAAWFPSAKDTCFTPAQQGSDTFLPPEENHVIEQLDDNKTKQGSNIMDWIYLDVNMYIYKYICELITQSMPCLLILLKWDVGKSSQVC